ncbi:MAG TPA: sigma-70 family RNA polymerase sigma factor [Dehalococcoidia bacterium]|nr:sigma-70 family RNA polymerase sigma factor [Dehalococcoidia bacterium]
MTDAQPGSNPTDDLELAGRARGGDLASFNELVERYQTSVYNLCLRMLGSVAADDATQEAFISAYRHLDRFRGGSFRAWLFSIASNACYDEMRRKKARPAFSLDHAAGPDDRAFDAPSGEPTMEAHAENTELRRALEAALQQLPEEQRLALVLCDVQGVDYAEIAEMTQTSLGTVKSRISRARARMRAILGERQELLPDTIRQTGDK